MSSQIQLHPDDEIKIFSTEFHDAGFFSLASRLDPDFIDFLQLPEGFNSWHQVYINLLPKKQQIEVETFVQMITRISIDEFIHVIEEFRPLDWSGIFLRDEIWMTLWKQHVKEEYPDKVLASFQDFIIQYTQSKTLKEKLLSLVEFDAINSIRKYEIFFDYIRPQDTNMLEAIFNACVEFNSSKVLSYLLKIYQYQPEKKIRNQMIVKCVEYAHLESLQEIVAPGEICYFVQMSTINDMFCMLDNISPEFMNYVFWICPQIDYHQKNDKIMETIIYEGHDNLISVFYQQGLRFNSENSFAILEAVGRDDKKMVDEFVKYGGDINNVYPENEDRTALAYAAGEKANFSMVLHLLSRGAKIEMDGYIAVKKALEGAIHKGKPYTIASYLLNIMFMDNVKIDLAPFVPELVSSIKKEFHKASKQITKKEDILSFYKKDSNKDMIDTFRFFCYLETPIPNRRMRLMEKMVCEAEF